MEVQTGKWQNRDTGQITIEAPGQGKYNVLKSIDVLSDAPCDITVESPDGTIVWSSKILFGGGGFTKVWGSEEGQGVYGAENSELIIKVSAGTYEISVNGIIVRSIG